jgi:hypothetical protein
MVVLGIELDSINQIARLPPDKLCDLQHAWGQGWAKQHVFFRSDNEAVVFMLNSRTSKVPELMRLLRSLLLAAARFNVSFSSLHIPGAHNSIADALSRFH